MDYDKLIDAVKLCGSTPKVDQCKQCSYWAGGDMGKCIPKMTADAATAIETFRADLARVTAELNDLRVQWDMYGGDVGITETYKELKRVKAERDAAVKCIGEIEDALKFQRISAIGLRISEWRNTKED